jgi:hypothetical protein
MQAEVTHGIRTRGFGFLGGEMKKKLRWRYYCDYCKASRGTRQSMEHHEERCTMNPNRKCGLCGIRDGGSGYLNECLDVLNLYLELAGTGEDLPRSVADKLREVSDGCPVCIYAALRQCGFLPLQLPGFNYESESKSMFDDAMDEIRQENMSIVGMPYIG